MFSLYSSLFVPLFCRQKWAQFMFQQRSPVAQRMPRICPSSSSSLSSLHLTIDFQPAINRASNFSSHSSVSLSLDVSLSVATQNRRRCSCNFFSNISSFCLNLKTCLCRQLSSSYRNYKRYINKTFLSLLLLLQSLLPSFLCCTFTACLLT